MDSLSHCMQHSRVELELHSFGREIEKGTTKKLMAQTRKKKLTTKKFDKNTSKHLVCHMVI